MFFLGFVEINWAKFFNIGLSWAKHMTTLLQYSFLVTMKNVSPFLRRLIRYKLPLSQKMRTNKFAVAITISNHPKTNIKIQL